LLLGLEKFGQKWLMITMNFPGGCDFNNFAILEPNPNPEFPATTTKFQPFSFLQIISQFRFAFASLSLRFILTSTSQLLIISFASFASQELSHKGGSPVMLLIQIA
jgi:hypothetical protein